MAGLLPKAGPEMCNEDELEDLRENWGEAYKVNAAVGRWIAVRRDTGEVIWARSAEELRGKIRDDYREGPCPGSSPI